MIGYPVVMDGSRIRALVVGAGTVATRKIGALLDAGAAVHVVAPDADAEIRARAGRNELQWTQSTYDSSHIAESNLVFAATNSREVNDRVAGDARARSIPVNVASDAEAGDFYTPAMHRDGSLLVAVFASGVPAAAARVRDFVARQLDSRLGQAIARLAHMRKTQFERGDAQQWRDSSRELIGEDFVASVTNGDFERRVERWR